MTQPWTPEIGKKALEDMKHENGRPNKKTNDGTHKV
jgi:hypothetical protein